jgi:hypothetical protein
MMKRNKILIMLYIALVMVLAVSLLTGCSSSKSTTPVGKYEIIRKAVLGNTWQMYQIRVVLESGSDFDIDLLELAGTDKVDGYFYPEKGVGASLEIKAGSLVLYKADPATVALGGTLSDRFSFQANQPAGTAYVIIFHNGGTDTVNVFVELIYPKSGMIRGPIDIK